MDAWLRRMYERHGSRYIWGAAFAVFMTEVLFVGPTGISVPAHYQRLSVGEALEGLAVLTALMIPYWGLLSYVYRGQYRSLARWANGERGDRLRVSASDAAFRLPRKLVLGLIPGLLLANASGTAVVLTLADNLTFRYFAEIAIGGCVAIVFALLLLFSLTELAFRPIRADLQLSRQPEGSRSALAARLLLVLIFPAIAGIFAGGLSVQTGDGSLFMVYLWSALASLAGAVVMGPLLVAGALGPVRDLIRGTRVVASGRLETEIPITTNDELGELTESFNEMVATLRAQASELRASQARIVAAADESRRRVERDLHDGAQQSLVLLNLKLAAVKKRITTDPLVAERAVEEAQSDLERALAELRDLAHGIYPQVLITDGLPGALAEAAEQAQLPVSLSLNGDRRYPPEFEAAIYFCCLEALQNVVKHAGEAASASVTLRQTGDALRFVVADDGAGFDADGSVESAGLQNMADRIGALGGELAVESRPGAGTRVTGTVPL